MTWKVGVPTRNPDRIDVEIAAQYENWMAVLQSSGAQPTDEHMAAARQAYNVGAVLYQDMLVWAGVRSAPATEPPDYAEYMRLSREQMARDRAKFTGGE